MTESHEIDYLRRLLQMNPLEQSDDIIANRNSFLQHVENATDSTDEDISHFERREIIVQQIDLLRNSFWSLKEQDLMRQLNAIDTSDFPDLDLAINRLKKIATLRKSFNCLKQHPACFTRFYDQFCALVVASSKEAGDLRMSLLNSAAQKNQNSDGHRSWEYRRIAIELQRQFPELADLELMCLSQLGEKPKPEPLSSNLIGILNGLSFICLFVLVLFCLFYFGYVAITP
ncbi:hypothetical protein [uncultured Gimesia sp.]|uniref:hypothetical protein n=1 Tax=uncultured Gimesia sp. TaxID=1678688 RepID=UPI0026024759|nr:hypothetical protein [uncultured Gimesia sp.]